MAQNAFEKELGIPKPKCCSNGACCKGASPSTPFRELFKRSAEGDEFARGFFSIMVPYPNHEAARKVVPGLVEKTLEAAEKSDGFKRPEEDVVFYHCRYLLPNNKCGVHEDRPQFCRDYPDTPFVVMAPGCAYIPWGKACKDKYFKMKDEVEELSNLKQELALLLQGASQGGNEYTKIDEGVFSGDNGPNGQNLTDYELENLSLVLSLTDLYLASPFQSYMFYE